MGDSRTRGSSIHPAMLKKLLDQEPRAVEYVQVGTALTLDCVWRDGRRLGLPYAYMTLVRWSGTAVIAVDAPELLLIIEGEGLSQVYVGLCLHRVSRVRELDATAADGVVTIRRLAVRGKS